MSFGHSGQGAAQHLTLLPIEGPPGVILVDTEPTPM